MAFPFGLKESASSRDHTETTLFKPHLQNMPVNPFSLNLPASIVFGRGSLKQLPGKLRLNAQSSVFVLTDEILLRIGTAGKAVEALQSAGATVHTFAEVPAEPPTTCVDDAVQFIRKVLNGSRPDVVIGIGGGSVLDITKIVALCLGHDAPADDFFGIDRVSSRGLPTALIPTTAGTGSEVTPVSVLTNVEKQVKARTWSPHIIPNLALIDPALTDSVPPRVTAATGIDALVHAIEAYIAKVSNPYSRAMSLEAARLLSAGLRRVYKDGSDADARDSVALGSHLAGLAFANSSCAAVHALALPLGGRFHIAHGEANANLLAATMRVNLPACREEFTTIATAMGLPDTRPEAFIDELQSLKSDLGIPDSLTAYGVTREALHDLASHAVEIRTLIEPNPVPVDVETAVAIYESCL